MEHEDYIQSSLTVRVHSHWRKKEEQIFKNRRESWSGLCTEFTPCLTPLCCKDIAMTGKKLKQSNWAQNNHLCNRNKKLGAVETMGLEVVMVLNLTFCRVRGLLALMGQGARVTFMAKGRG